MAQFASAEDILKLAIAKEVRAHKFYTILADKVVNPAMRSLLLEFAREEQEHKETLEMELMKAGKVVLFDSEPVNFDVESYLPGLEVRSDLDYKELLLLAIKKERESFKFYFNLALRAKDEHFREILLALAEEESRHRCSLELDYGDLTHREKPTEY